MNKFLSSQFPLFKFLMRLIPLSLLLLSIGFSMERTENADEIFLKASQLASTDLGQARELYRVAALHYLEKAKADPTHQGPLLYNAGNAFFLAGDSGHAIIAYRQAEKWIPGSCFLRDNLAFVRKQSGNPKLEISPSSSLGKFLFWIKNPAILWVLLFLLFLLLWIELFSRQWRGHGHPFFPLRTFLFLIFLVGLSLISVKIQNSKKRRGVLIVPEVEARKGPNYGYAPAFTSSLDPGMECEIVGKQDDWLQIRLSSSRTAWVRHSTVEMIP